MYNKHIESKTAVYPKTILYIGRFAPEKNIELLIDVFKELQNRFPEWRLLLVGNGSLREVISASPGIEIHPFLTPEQLSNILSSAGVFCLPSKSEPWGVVIHEMAAYGLPIIVSDACGAGQEFVRNGLNGFRFKSEDKESLKEALQSMMNLESKALIDMGIQSNLMSKHISPEGWAAELYNLM